jgi:4-diphosphocytidyl-2-C-methyl-D-erythritol kinase
LWRRGEAGRFHEHPDVTSSLLAPAKVNLFLHVGALEPDGRHLLCSLMVFADIGDRLAVRPADALELRIEGPFAAGLTAGPDNLVMRAAVALLARIGVADTPLQLVLTKMLPLAAGLGGGSSDAGAALRLLRDELRGRLDDAALEAIAGELGADGPACLHGRPVIAEGRGERLSAAPRLPPLDAVLVNPGVASPTGVVYRMFDDLGGSSGADRPPLPPTFDDVRDVAGFLANCRNDLEAPAVTLNSVVGEVLQTLTEQPECLLARVSGSGATCFALCASSEQAERLARRLQSFGPDWWVRPCRLGGPWA